MNQGQGGCWPSWKEPLGGYQDPVFWAWLDFFSPLWSTNCKTIHYLLSSFLSQTLNSQYHKSTHCRLFGAEIPKRYKCTSKRYDEHAPSFLFGIPPFPRMWSKLDAMQSQVKLPCKHVGLYWNANKRSWQANLLGYPFLITKIKNILPLQSSVKIRYSDIPWSVSFSFSEAAE